MGRQSTIAKLPPDVRAKLEQMVRDGSHTIDEIVAEVQGMGGEVKRTAVGDFKKKMEASLARVREARDVAGVWVKNLGEEEDSKGGQLLMQLLHTIAFQTLADLGGQQDGAEPMDIMLLSKAIKDLAGAQKTDLEFRTKLREQFKREMAERAAAAAEEAVKIAKAGVSQAGLSETAAAELREKILGIVG